GKMIKKKKEKFLAIVDQVQQYVKESDYFGDYFGNIVRIILGIEVIDYRVISHKNLIVKYSQKHRFF
ncbi:MAG: hypothetical protein Q7T50_05005, partial [Candidatus Magasanikbacteria bacterium]|nr:hypothetical protein [Candidatus Magasanikbacteria bacterium]